MNIIKRYYILISVVVLFIGIFLNVISSDISPETKTIYVATGNNQTKTHEIIEYPFYKDILTTSANVCYSFAITLFIALFVISRLDEKEKEDFNGKILQLQKSINKDVLSSTFEKIIPNEIFDLIKSDILDAKSIRKNSKWYYDFAVENGKTIITQTFIVELHNSTNSIIEEHIKLNFFRDENSTSYVSFFSCVGSNSDNEISIENTNSCEIIDEKIELDPYKFATITLSTVTETDKDYIIDTDTTKSPIINLDLTVNFPLGYVVELFPTCSNSLTCLKASETKQIYKTIPALLKGQGIIYKFYKKPANK